MTDDLDRILRSEETLLPSSGFLARVMAEVEAPPPLPFPWWRFGLGLTLTTLAAAVTVSLAPAPTFGPELAEALSSTQLWTAAGALAGTWLLVRLTLRLAGVAARGDVA